ncbi:MAG: sulfotransferase family protein [Deltaproteobacteria bacterium]|nr:sulfotransferase family protein [Deltaproteobacteria bacterium]
MVPTTNNKIKIQYIAIVSGLPRSGTSMMSMMLEAGGMSVLTDNIRMADRDNPKGYYEFERVKRIPKGDIEWMKDAKGKAVKVISELLQYLPAKYEYKVIFMHRKMEEIVKSQNKMLMNLGKPVNTDNVLMVELLLKHLARVRRWLDKQNNIKVLDVNYNQLIVNPTPFLPEINKLLEETLSIEKMKQAIDLKLYRNRV